MEYKSYRLTNGERKTIKNLYFEEKQSLTQIAKLLNRNETTIWRWVKRFGQPRNYSEAGILANQNGRGQGIKNFGSNHGRWKEAKINFGGYFAVHSSKDSPFYCMAYKGDYILEHRLVMAEYLGRPLTSEEIVHHLNGIRTDNRFCNLALVTRRNHPSLTLPKLLQKRIRDLEAELSQQKLGF